MISYASKMYKKSSMLYICLISNGLVGLIAASKHLLLTTIKR